MGNTVLQPKELLGVLLLKTTASRNKMLRMKWSYEGECFKIIEYGHDIYHLSPTNPNAPYDIIVRRNSWPDFLYASVYKKIAYEGYISVFRDTLAKILLLDLQGIFHLISDVMEKMQENIV